MKTVALKLKNVTENRNIIVWVLSGILVCLVSLYLFFINNAVMNISIHESNLDKMATMESKLSSLELKYIEQAGGINMALAESLGFSDASRKSSFVIRKSSSVTLARETLDEI